MKTPEQKAALEATGRIGDQMTLALQIASLHAAVKAMLATHPEPDRVRAVYDQLLGQFIASPAVAGFPDHALVLRDLTATLFAPPVVLDTGD